MPEKKSSPRLVRPPDPDEPGYRAVYDFKRFVDRLVAQEGGNEDRLVRVFNVGRGAFQAYRIPTPQGPSLATLGRISHRLGMPLREVVGPGATPRKPTPMTHHALLSLSPPQLERLLAILTALEDAGLLEAGLSAAESLADHLLKAKRKGPPQKK